MRRGQRATFAGLYGELGRKLRISYFMAELFLQGRQFNPELFNSYCLRERDATGKTALHYAVCGGVDLLRPSVENRLARPLLRAQDENGVTALMLAAERGEVGVVEQLLGEAGAQDSCGRSALMYAIVAGKAAAAYALIKHEGNIRDHNGDSYIEYMMRYDMQEKIMQIRDFRGAKKAIKEQNRLPVGVDVKYIEDQDVMAHGPVSVSLSK